ncbi:MAG: type II toxin-antitoxin system Phd/YefM family antitoxin [Opitutales bacterium]
MIPLYDAKNRFSEICKQVSETRQACVISRRGQPTVKIVPFYDEGSEHAAATPVSVWDTVGESRARYGELTDEFELPERSGHSKPSPLDSEA